MKIRVRFNKGQYQADEFLAWSYYHAYKKFDKTSATKIVERRATHNIFVTPT